MNENGGNMKISNNIEYECIYSVNGMLAAEMIKNFLAAHDIDSFINQESIGSTFGLNLGQLGEAMIFVRKKDADIAKRLLKDMEEDRFINNFTDGIP